MTELCCHSVSSFLLPVETRPFSSDVHQRNICCKLVLAYLATGPLENANVFFQVDMHWIQLLFLSQMH